MDFLISLMLNKYLWLIITILVSVFTLWATFQAIALGVRIGIFLKAMWIIVAILWLSILVRGFFEFVLKDTNAQIIIFLLVAGYLWFSATPTKKQLKRGTKR